MNKTYNFVIYTLVSADIIVGTCYYLALKNSIDLMVYNGGKCDRF